MKYYKLWLILLVIDMSNRILSLVLYPLCVIPLNSMTVHVNNSSISDTSVNLTVDREFSNIGSKLLIEYRKDNTDISNSTVYTSIPIHNETILTIHSEDCEILSISTHNKSTINTNPIVFNLSLIISDQLLSLANNKLFKVITNSYEKALEFFNINKTIKENSLIAITFINGIFHSEEDWRMISDNISMIFGIVVKPFYNPSSGSWINDASKASLARLLKPNDIPTAKALAEHLRSTLMTLGPNGRILHLAHSGGAILTYLAAKYHLTEEEREKIDIVTFGGGRSITRKYFRGRIVNYYSENDLVSLVDVRAAGLKKSLLGNVSWTEIRDKKHNTSFVFMKALANDVLLDHSMNGPTYKQALLREAEELKKRLKALISIENKNKDIVRLTRKKLANITGIHHFWDSPVSSVSNRLSSLITYEKLSDSTVFSQNVIKKALAFGSDSLMSIPISLNASEVTSTSYWNNASQMISKYFHSTKISLFNSLPKSF